MQLNLIFHVHLTSGFKCRNFLIGIQPHHTTSLGIARMFYCLKVCLNYVRARLEQLLPPSPLPAWAGTDIKLLWGVRRVEYRTFLSIEHFSARTEVSVQFHF